LRLTILAQRRLVYAESLIALVFALMINVK